MNLKSKLFGFGAASVLALSMTTGVVAQDSASTGVEVELVPGQCSIAVTQSNIDFGTFVYENGQWVNGEGGKYRDVDVDVNVPYPNATCDVEISLENNALFNENSDQIPGTYLNFDAWDYGSGINPLGAPFVVTFQEAPLNASLWLEDVPDDAQPGTYTGTLNLKIVDSI